MQQLGPSLMIVIYNRNVVVLLSKSLYLVSPQIKPISYIYIYRDMVKNSKPGFKILTIRIRMGTTQLLPIVNSSVLLKVLFWEGRKLLGREEIRMKEKMVIWDLEKKKF